MELIDPGSKIKGWQFDNTADKVSAGPLLTSSLCRLMVLMESLFFILGQRRNRLAEFWLGSNIGTDRANLWSPLAKDLSATLSRGNQKSYRIREIYCSGMHKKNIHKLN